MKPAKLEGQEEALIAGLPAGNEADFQQAVRLYTPGMLAVARYQCRGSGSGLLGFGD